ncbi:unnamed protein product [Hydatigera taeniaeformis]|uniref:Uncharacterized protein n=1 Tax=Hydatigena taeniaeformis TaxID=6205 RepID=A0A0R3WME5_HYDTA|nr:unnamed protein product [Hydatigera taeniaeformis]
MFLFMYGIFMISLNVVRRAVAHLLRPGDASEKENQGNFQKQEHHGGLFSGLSGGSAAALLARLGGGGDGSSSLLGEGGKPVRLPANLMADSKAKFGLNQFDVVVSNLISVNRSLPDVRHPS